MITHGGNNTVTECLHFGKPMIVLPLFWDQYDNAQRLDETGFGVRLDTYSHEPRELRAAIDRLLADESLAARRSTPLAGCSAARGTERAADLIERQPRGRLFRSCVVTTINRTYKRFHLNLKSLIPLAVGGGSQRRARGRLRGCGRLATASRSRSPIASSASSRRSRSGGRAALGVGAAEDLARVEEAGRFSGTSRERIARAAALDLALDPIPVREDAGRGLGVAPASSSRASDSSKTCGWRRISFSVIRLGDRRRDRPAPRSSSSSERKTTWKRTSPSSSSIFASSPLRRGVGELVGLLDGVGNDRALVLLAVPGHSTPQAACDRVEAL